MKEEKLFRIGEVAKMFHISMGTLRHYEQSGLVLPEKMNGPGIVITALNSWKN